MFIHSQQLLICKDCLLQEVTCTLVIELATSFQRYYLVFIHQELNFLDVVGVEPEHLVFHLSHWSVADASFRDDFPHLDHLTSLNSLLYDPPVPESIDGAYYSSPWTVAFMNELFELLHCFQTTSFRTPSKRTMSQ